LTLPPNLRGGPLTEADVVAFSDRWLRLEDLEAALLRRVPSIEGAEVVGQTGRPGDYAGILIPYLWPGENAVRDYRLRRDHPDLEQGPQGEIRPKRKYLAPPGRGNMLYLPPATDSEFLTETGLPVVLVEGEFKTLALSRLAWHGRGDTAELPAFLPIGLQGVYSWRSTVGKTSDAEGSRTDVRGPVHDLSRIAWKNRRVIIVFDLDVVQNPMVAAARRDLTRELEERGAEVAWFKWPHDTPVELKGIDDFLAGRGPVAVLKLLAQAKTVTRRKRSVEAVADLSVENWERQLMRNENGGIKPLLANAILFLKNSPEWNEVLAFDEFAVRVRVLSGCPWNPEPHDWDDVSDIKLAEWLQQRGCHVSVMTANFAAQAVARERCFHPPRDYLRGLEWDKTLRIDRWLVTYFSAADTKLNCEVGARWLTSAIARVMQPACQADHCLILQGIQGIGKSTAMRIMGGDWFTDDIDDLGSKDSALQVSGVWIVEFAELEAMLGVRADALRVNAFITRRVDHFRPPYGHHTIDLPRQCVFVGTVNRTEFLRDETGARRFWPVACGAVNVAALERDRDQIWAESRVRFESGASWHLTDPEALLAAQEEQDFRYVRDAWDSIVGDWIEGARQAWVNDGKPVAAFVVTQDEILAKALEKPKQQWTQADRYRIGRILRACGMEYVRERIVDFDGEPVKDPRGQQQRRYVYRWPARPSAVPP